MGLEPATGGLQTRLGRSASVRRVYHYAQPSALSGQSHRGCSRPLLPALLPHADKVHLGTRPAPISRRQRAISTDDVPLTARGQ